MRKHLAATALLCLFAAPALAQTTTATGTGVGVSESNSAAGAVAINRGNGGNSSLTINNPANTTSTSTSTINGTTTSNINQNVRTSGTSSVKTVPTAVAPSLAAAGLETCLGSASGGVSALGFGVTGGATMTDEGCQARLDSRTLWSMGLKGAAVARLCKRIDIYNSMPDICERYRPVAAPTAGVGIVMSTTETGGAVRVIDGRDGVEKDCLNYSHTKSKCYQWAGQPPVRRKKVAAMTPPKSVTPKVAERPAAPAADSPTKEN